MKTTAFTANDFAHDELASAPATAQPRFLQVIARFFEAVKGAQAERLMRSELAELDDHVLRDIGIADDELVGVRAKLRFTPRAWRE